MFSKKDVESLFLSFEFPIKKKEDLVETVIGKIPLATINLKTSKIFTLFRRLSDRVPQFEFSGAGMEDRLLKNSLTLNLGMSERTPLLSARERRNKIEKAFSEKTLTKLNSDLNFLLGKISTLLEEKERKIKVSGVMKLKKTLESKISLNNNLEKEVLSSLKEIGRIKLKGFRIDFTKRGLISSVDIRSLNKRLNVAVGLELSGDKPINISELVTTTLNELNDYYQKLKVD